MKAKRIKQIVISVIIMSPVILVVGLLAVTFVKERVQRYSISSKAQEHPAVRTIEVIDYSEKEVNAAMDAAEKSAEDSGTAYFSDMEFIQNEWNCYTDGDTEYIRLQCNMVYYDEMMMDIDEWYATAYLHKSQGNNEWTMGSYGAC